MPPIVVAAAIAMAGAAMATAAGVAAFTAMGILAIGAITLTLGFVSKALAPKPRRPSFGSLSEEARGRTVLVRSSSEPHRVIYGTAVVSGPLVFAATTGDANEFLHLVIALAGHQVEAINTVWLNDLPSTDARFSGFVRVNTVLGREDQAVDADLDAEVADWTSSHRLRGIAYIYVRLKWDANVWVNGIPNIKAEVQGKRVWDPRSSSVSVTSSSVANPTTITTAAAHGLVAGDRVFIIGHSGSTPKIDGEYLVLSAPLSTTFTIDVNVTVGGTSGASYKMLFFKNAALCQLDYLISKMGIEAATEEVDTPSWSAAANVCDEQVALAAGGTHDRYDCDGVFTREERPIDVMDKLLTASAGTMVYQQGTYRGYAGAFVTPTVTLDKDDLRGNIELHSKPSRRDLFNAVRGTFVDAANFYQPADFTPITNVTYESQDNNLRLYRDIELPFTTNNFRAQRIAKVYLERARRGITVKFPAKLTALELAAWDTVQVTISRLGWTNKVFRVLEWELAEDGGVDLTLQEEDPNVYVWTAEEVALPAAPTTTLPNPFSVAVVSVFALASGGPTQLISGDGTVHSRIKASWTAPTDQFVVSGGRVELQFKKTVDVAWNPSFFVPDPASTTQAFIAPVDSGVSYDVRARNVNNAGVVSAWVTRTNVVSGDATAPAVPTGIIATGGFQVVVLRWTNPTDLDFDQVEIYRSTSNDSATATLVGRRRSDVFGDTKLANATTYFYWLKSRDTTGNVSAFHAGQFAGVSATTLRAVSDDIATDAVITRTIGPAAVTADGIFSNDAAAGLLATAEVEIGSISIVTDGGMTEVIAKVSMTGAGDTSTIFKIRKDSTSGAILDTLELPANQPMGATLIGKDSSPAATQVYKFYGVQKTTGGTIVSTVEHRRLFAINVKK